jgi:hypothetical protein
MTIDRTLKVTNTYYNISLDLIISDTSVQQPFLADTMMRLGILVQSLGLLTCTREILASSLY